MGKSPPMIRGFPKSARTYKATSSIAAATPGLASGAVTVRTTLTSSGPRFLARNSMLGGMFSSTLLIARVAIGKNEIVCESHNPRQPRMSTRRCNTVCVMRPSLPNKRRYENATVNGGEKSGRIEIVRKKLFPGTSGRVNARAKTNPRMQAGVVERTVITRGFTMGRGPRRGAHQAGKGNHHGY